MSQVKYTVEISRNCFNKTGRTWILLRRPRMHRATKMVRARSPSQTSCDSWLQPEMIRTGRNYIYIIILYI